MTAHVVVSDKRPRKAGRFLLLPFALIVALAAAVGGFIAYVLWPTWPGTPVALDAPALPITVAGVLFEVPPAAIRVAVQRHPGPHERIDLAFVWPALTPPPPDANSNVYQQHPDASVQDSKPAASATRGLLFVTIAPLGPVLPPVQRLRDIYPRYVEAAASAGADGLAILPFRAGTPYQSEDLVYVAEAPERFFARCTRQAGVVASSCIADRLIGDANITLRFPRDWLGDWRSVAAGFDRLLAQLTPVAGSQKSESEKAAINR